MFRILNNTVSSWPEDSVIMNDCADIRLGSRNFSFHLKSRQLAYLTINFKIPEMAGDQNLKITFFFYSQKKAIVFG